MDLIFFSWIQKHKFYCKNNRINSKIFFEIIKNIFYDKIGVQFSFEINLKFSSSSDSLFLLKFKFEFKTDLIVGGLNG